MSTIIPEERRTAVYRLYDAADKLLYVGIAYDVAARWSQHSKTQPWWNDVVTHKVEWHPRRADAARAEYTAIKTEKPKYNITFGNPEWLMSEGEQTYFEFIRRFVPLISHSDGTNMSEYMVPSPTLLAPGTYLITFGFNPTADPETEAFVYVTDLQLVATEDDYVRQHGAQCWRPGHDGEPRTDACGCYRHTNTGREEKPASEAWNELTKHLFDN